MGRDLGGHCSPTASTARVGTVSCAKEFVDKFGSDGVRGLFFGDASQLLAQLIDAGVVAAFGFAMAFTLFKVSNLIAPVRVPRETELQGLDIPEMGALGYPDFSIVSHPTDA